MESSNCCDVYCTSWRICYLKLLRPGDTVPFKPPKYLLPLGAAECLLSVVVIVLDVLAIYSQSQGLTSPSPSFLGSPGIPLWLASVLIIDGCIKVMAYKKKSRFSTAIAFGFSAMGTLLAIILIAILTMAISEEQRFEGTIGVVIATVLCILVLVLLFVTSLSILSTYLALTSHDDRWFTDRGTQCDALESSCGEGKAKLTVPSGQPAFLFYAPSNEAMKYTNTFQHVMKNMEAKDQTTGNKDLFEAATGSRKEGDFSDDDVTYVSSVPSSAVRQKAIADNYLHAPSHA